MYGSVMNTWTEILKCPGDRVSTVYRNGVSRRERWKYK